MVRHFIVSILLCVASAGVHAAEPSFKPASTLGEQLVFAASVGSAEEVQGLIQAGADPKIAQNSAGTPALLLAAQRTDAPGPAVVSALLDAGVNPETMDARGQTALFYAVRRGALPTLNLLLERGADAAHLDVNGNNVRSLAYQEKQTAALKAIDDFTAAKAKAIADAYAARSQQLAAQAAAQNQAAKQPAVPTPAAQTAPLNDADRAALLGHIRTLSYHACALTYWETCRERRLSTELSRTQLNSTIDAHRTLVQGESKALREKYAATPEYLSRITGPSTQRMKEELNAPFLTNAHRAAEGIGKKTDMDTRCNAIADQWELEGGL